MCAKSKTKYVCKNCGAVSIQWLGRCNQCGEWNTLEEVVETEAPKHLKLIDGGTKRSQKLSEIRTENHPRFLLGMSEVDRPLGGGIVPGSVILWGGEPGIGKSTLILQICHAVAKEGHTVLYAGGEESDLQIKMRAERLGMDEDSCLILQGGNLDAIVEEAKKLRPAMVVIDSIQTMYLAEKEGTVGSPAQIRDCTATLVALAKEYHISVMIIGHVTKEGNLAGPRMLEHMVDVVFYLEGDRNYQFRVLRTVKNRFGSTAESGLFVMEEQGLLGISDPSTYLLQERGQTTTGSLVAACMEGRPVLVEIQTLSVHSLLAIPRRIAVGYDYNRMLMLLAVLEKKGYVSFSTDDVYLNVAGGYKVKETAADLSVVLALVSGKKDIVPPPRFMAMGEIGLTGQILPVSKLELRLKDAMKMNFTHFMLPERNRGEAEQCFSKNGRPEYIERTLFVKDLAEALSTFHS